MTSPLILDNVSKSFAGKPAVRSVSLEITSGEIIGFLGPNGAGKTSTIRMALGLITPDEGHVSLFGGPPGPQAFGRIGFLPEERGLYKKQNPREAIAFMAQLNGMSRRAAFDRADELLEQYGLGEAKKLKNNKLSKGMAQKVQLLSAIAHRPEFYILDEPFSGLDPVNQALLEGMIRDLAKSGATILFSTHVMEHAERLCDRIILMSDGNKIFDGSLESALSHAPRRLIIGSDDMRLAGLLTPFSDAVESLADGALCLDLKPQTDAQQVLAKAVKADIKLTRFEPKLAGLHDVFVSLVGDDGAPS